MKRYNAVVGGVYDNSVMVDERDGDWVWYEDWEAMQSKCAELEAKCAELLQASEAIVARWDSPLWKDQPHTGIFIDQLRAAIVKAKGEQP